ncbi:MAG TPA: HAMP domain-containing sensor histidine kinase [Bacteriovoracaceae bacterium]|nr:HAMP domain-containing sensor histidine kinase [Bacteriovoracaceae bacterium]
MELNKTRRWFYGLTLFWVIFLLLLGSWWLYLVFKLHADLSALNLEALASQERFLNMMRWEGTFFFVVLIILGISLLIMYIRDMRKSQALQAFFSSLSHELKTPLASMRLQAEVIKDLIEDESHSHEQLSNLTGRLIEDTHKLEGELEKSLQLSRIENDAPLSLAPLSLERYLKRHQSKMKDTHQIELVFQEDASEVLADELALNIIFRNLFENTKRHQPESKRIRINSYRQNGNIHILYDDFGKVFTGDIKKLGTLFYKFNSTKGSGIGLFLIKNLMRKMQGNFEIQQSDHLRFQLTFKAPKGEDQ